MHSNFYKLSNHTPFNNSKYALISPLLGAASSLFLLIIYCLFTMWAEHAFLKLNFVNGLFVFFKLVPTLIIIAMLFSYALSLFSFLPLYKLRINRKWSDGKFWFFNSLLGSIVGLLITFLYSIHVNPFLMFITFTMAFFSSLFTSSLYTNLIKLRAENNDELRKNSLSTINTDNIDDKKVKEKVNDDFINL